ncbi:MAG TPA: hypothetical protein VIF15_08280 [Polyangiaceae bacterium]
MRRCGAAAAVAALLLGGHVASAQEPPASSPPPRQPAPAQPPPAAQSPYPKHESTWYGWQILAVDAAGIGAGLGALAVTSGENIDPAHVPSPAGYLATGLYAVGSVGGPAVHWAHGQIGKGFGDMAMRVLGPPTIGLFGMLFYCGTRQFNDCAQNGMIGGVLAGEVLASGIDAALLADDDDRPLHPKPQGDWYGPHVWLADAASLGFGVYVATANQNNGQSSLSAIEAAGLGWWAVSWLVAPIAHFAHGRIGYGFADVGMRLIVPPVLGVVGILGYCSTTGGIRDCAIDGLAGGIGLGTLGVSLFDGLVLAHEAPPEEPEKEPAPSTGWSPVIQPVRGGATLGAGGMF